MEAPSRHSKALAAILCTVGLVDVCVVLYRSTTDRVEGGIREHDRLLVRDNTHDNIGFAAGANRAAALGSDPLVCFVNPDGDLTVGLLDRFEETMSDESVAACSADLGPMNPPLLPNGDAELLLGTCFVVRRSLFEAVGGFDERLFMYREDDDLSYKLRQHGRLVVVKDAVFTHDWGHSVKFANQHRLCRNYLVVQKRHRTADPLRMIRDAVFALRQRRWVDAAARTSGTIDFLVRARRWA